MEKTTTFVQTELISVRQLHLPALSLDCEGRFTAVNPAAEKLFARPVSGLIGQPMTLVLDPGSYAKAELMLERVFESGQVDDWELDHIRAGEDPFLVGYSASVLRDNIGQPIGIIAVGRDLSKKLDLTQQLAVSNQQLEGALLQLEKAQVQLVQSEKMRSLGQMVAGVAHEINNPASYVANNLSHLEKMLPALHDLRQAFSNGPTELDEPEKRLQIKKVFSDEVLWDDLPDLVRESRDGIERIREIVASLRSFSHIDDHQVVKADLNEGLRATLRMVRSLWNTDIEFRETYGSLPQIKCHPGEMNQVFLNLLTNAIQAITANADHGSIWIESIANQDHVLISIRDNGHGMEENTLARLGEPFFTTRQVGAGTGLGLATSFGIVEKHQGTLTFLSRPGEGTTAVIRLPLRH